MNHRLICLGIAAALCTGAAAQLPSEKKATAIHPKVRLAPAGKPVQASSLPSEKPLPTVATKAGAQEKRAVPSSSLPSERKQPVDLTPRVRVGS